MEIVLTLENVVEDAEASTNSGLGVAENIPCETEARRPIVLVGKVCALGRTRVARKNDARGRVDKTLALLARQEAERSPLGILLRLGIFIT